jgi:hypothetical protein
MEDLTKHFISEGKLTTEYIRDAIKNICKLEEQDFCYRCFRCVKGDRENVGENVCKECYQTFCNECISKLKEPLSGKNCYHCVENREYIKKHSMF